MAGVSWLQPKLFGYFDYDLFGEDFKHEDLARLAILYGLNGTGKTTILKLAYHLLSPSREKGHKSELARTIFKKFGVTLLDGTAVWAERKEDKSGSFVLHVVIPKNKTAIYEFVAVDDPPRIPADRPEGPDFETVMKLLLEVSSSFFYLSDDRSLDIEYHDPLGTQTSLDTSFLESYLRRSEYTSRTSGSEEKSVAVVFALEAAIQSLHQWFSVQVNRLSSDGFASAHSVYGQVIKQIASPGKRGGRHKGSDLNQQVQKLLLLADESKTFEKYGLSSAIDAQPLTKILNKARAYKKHMLSNLLSAYLETLENRFDELRSIYDVIDNLIAHLNSFLYPKVVRFRLGDGLTIYAPNNKILSPRMLSSGERHLLLILCCTLLSSNRRAIFIIDEPEISLNMSWQRKLLEAILSISASAQVQFLMASHSMQLISSYMRNVVKLTPKR
ncbi:MAG: AAA family ATPase [Planctomycetota bacterium]|nr:AAA family ATPase [Planctomycetota bacterium]